ncbi:MULTISPECIES: ABC transporter ATP-binding protein [Paraliobacillus]|uniref:ABC transporter ATP-binding protein n=1 Tax=Paraliobacillus TaxID=200903 RepID=UPI000DD30464|nr:MULTISPECIES: ABC transporter ATP-binding protein [Paraliobacillus]
MILEIKKAGLLRNGTWILKELDWKIQNQEHWALLGLNGAGKTALLHMLCAYYFPTEGEVTVLGKRFGKDRLGEELRQKIGIVSSIIQGRFYEADSAYQIVLSGAFASIGLYETPTDDMRDKAQNLLKDLGCFSYANRSFYTLSQGERQRVMVARALMADPELLILDEPTNGLDFMAREQLLESIEHLTNQPNCPSFIYVTHHVEEILQCFNKTLLLKNGKVFEAGNTKDIMQEDKLSTFFGTNIELIWQDNRPTIRKR